MRVAVVVCLAPAAGHLFHGDDAAFKLFTALMLELDGGVSDLEVLLEHVVELDQDAGAL